MYKGYVNIELNDEEMAEFYSGEVGLEGLHIEENEYCVVYDERGKAVDKYCCRNGRLDRVDPNARFSNSYMGTIKPRNLEQELAFDMLADRESKVKVVRGVYGSGKDYIMLASALQYIEDGTFDKIVYIRPNVTVKDVPDIGYLPGDANEKLAWTLGPLFDKVGGYEGIEFLERSGKLEAVPLLHIRGRSFENSIIYVSEGQNMTKEMILEMAKKMVEVLNNLKVDKALVLQNLFINFITQI